MKNRGWLVSVMAIALASCGGDSDGDTGTDDGTPSGGVETPAPTPTPSASPTPTPTPSASPTPTPTPPPAAATPGTAFNDLSGGVILQSAETGFLTRTDPPQEVGVKDFGQGVRYIYDVATRSMRVENGASATQFTAAELDNGAPAGTTRYAKADGSRLSLVAPAPDGGALRYTRFIDALVNAPEATRLLSLTGVPTPSGEIPTEGTGSFPRTEVLGHAYLRVDGVTKTYAVEGTQGTLSIDYADRRIAFTMTLIGRPTDGSAAVTLLKANGSVDIDGSNPNFTVSSPIVSRSLAFMMTGALFGPSAVEVGAAFSYRGASADGQTVLNFAGLAAGGK